MRKTIKKVIILGSSALKIGEAGEFDYSGSQAIKALKEEGIKTILVNPNIATIQTSENMADEVYFLPVSPYFVERIIEKERPDGILLGFGGQTALNCGLELEPALEKHGVRVLGTPIRAIRDTEDRGLFVERLEEIGARTPKSRPVSTVDHACAAALELGYPVMIRTAFSLGGLGSGVCADEAELRELSAKALSHAPQVLVEECLRGWKEIEYEVVRDVHDNCITVCNMENLDPMGIHTGESIVVAPSQTLTNAEYHMLRKVAIDVIRHLGIVGECNIQYALSPDSQEYRIIEVNARLSRSSALASKATGYPLAFVAAKLALGYGLHEIENSVTRVTKACFEPALDYIVVKAPRWDLKKFRRVSRRIGSGMKSVGEVMAIGRKFEEALQKALRMLEIGVPGLVSGPVAHLADHEIEEELSHPTENRIFGVYEALRRGFAIEKVHGLSSIDPWFLHKIANLVRTAGELEAGKGREIPAPLLKESKRLGFSDIQIASLVGASPEEVRSRRHALRLRPCVKKIDTLAGEYPAKTNYLYLTYNGDEDDVAFDASRPVVVLGSGAYRIGSSVEFDWCCVNAVRALRGLGYKSVLLNCNPETVSTDYDECDRLYFDELSLETVLEICERERPLGVIVSVGGQIPNNLALRLSSEGVHILGTSAESIDTAEDRHKFSRLLDGLGVDQPEWEELTSLDEARVFANKTGYPVLVRPSYVLSGAAMSVASNDGELMRYLDRAAEVSPEHPIVLSKFIENAKEIEIDAVAQEGRVVVYAISEHVENAGVHSGDATLVLPPQRTYLETARKVRQLTASIAKALRINGPFNIQVLAKRNEVKGIECNLRASRSFPFVSKILKHNFIDTAVRAIMGYRVADTKTTFFSLDYVGVKAPQFSFTRLHGADPTLGVEMSSTGEVACIGDDFEEAFLKAFLSVGYKLPVKSVLLSTGTPESKMQFLESSRMMAGMGIRFFATGGTADFLRKHGLDAEVLHWPLEEKSPNTLEVIRGRRVDLVINIPKNTQEEELTNDYIIRRAAVDHGVPLVTNLQLAMRLVEALAAKRPRDLKVKSWSEYC